MTTRQTTSGPVSESATVTMLPTRVQDLQPAWRYAFALLTVAGALAARFALEPLLGAREPFVTFYLAVTLVAGIGGTGPALVAVAASLIAMSWLVPDVPSDADVSFWLIATASFLFVSAVTLVMFETARSARAKEAAHAARLAALADASLAITSAPTLEATLDTVTRQARRLIGSGHAMTILTAVSGRSPALRATDGAEPRAEPAATDDRDRRTSRQSALTAPLVGHDGRTLGALRVAQPFARAFTRDDEAILMQLAQQAAVAIENARAEDALRTSGARYRTLVEATSAVVWRANAAGSVIEAPGWTSLTGQSDNPRALPWSDLVHPDDRAAIARVWDAARRTESPAQGDYRLRTPDGRHRWVSLHGIPLRDARGVVREWIGTVTDVSALKRAEAERTAVLHQATKARARASSAADRLRRVQGIVDLMLSDLSLEPLLRQVLSRIVATLDADAAVIFLAEGDGLRLRAASGLDDVGLAQVRVPLDHGFAGAVARERRPLVWDEAQAATDDSEYVQRASLRSLLGVPLRIDERLLGVLHVGSKRVRRFGGDDIELLRLAAARIALGVELAARREAERHARAIVDAASHAKDEFLAMLSHELRNPLAAIRNAIAVARLDVARRGTALDIARRQSDQLARLVEDLLDVSRITRGTIGLHRERVRLDDVVTRALESVHGLIEDRRHTIAVDLPPEPLEVDGDCVRLVQALTNLLNNAAKYTSPGGHIDVSARRRDGKAVLRVHDDGAGISRELAPRIFDLFAQGEQPLDRSVGGLGIGLTVVKRIAELHGGSVSVRSEGQGSGSAFAIEIPALPPAAPPPATGTTHPESTARLRRARLLVVEDNLEAADAFSMLLHELGQDVQVVHDGLAALEAVRARPPEIALIDIGLPGMDGYEVARRMRRCRGVEKAILVALTGYGGEENRRRALAAGFDHHLIKPVDLDVLKDLLREAPDARAVG
jgi:PAS domain S-box-containing protein